MDIERSFMNIVTEITDAPETYLWFSLMHIASSCLGKYIICPLYMRPSSNPWRPNVWIILSGIPGIMRKSTVIDIDLHVITHALYEYYKARMPRASEETIHKIIQNIFIETGSPEGLAEHISEAQKDLDMFIIVSTEYGGVFQQMTKRDYMIGYASLLSKLWSGEQHIWRGAKKDRYIRSGLFVTAILGMQKPWLYLNTYLFQQGLMRRVFIIYAEPDDKSRWLPPLNLRKSVLMDELTSISHELAELMNAYENISPVKALFEPGVLDKINEFARKSEQEVINNPESIWALYSQNLWDHLVRFSICLASLRRRPERTTTFGYVLKVKEEDVRDAMRWIERTLPKTKKALTLVSTPVVKATITTAEGPLDFIHTLISENGRNGITASELLRKSKMIKDELKRYIINLIEENRIVAVVHKGRRGRPSLMFFDKRWESVALMHGDKIEARTLDAIW